MGQVIPVAPTPLALATKSRLSGPSADNQPYRSFAHFDTDGSSLSIITREFEGWLERQKRWGVDLSSTGTQIDGTRSLTIVRHSVGSADLLRFRLTEEQPGTGTWTTEFSACASAHGGSGWFLLEVGNSRRNWVQAPRVVTTLVDLLPVCPDESLQLTPQPARIGIHSVEELAARITDPDRHGLIVVAGTDERLDFDRFYEKVALWTQQVVGQAEVAVLDPLATAELRNVIGDSHAVSPWTIRTFMPGADPAEPGNHRQHRYLGPGPLADLSTHALQRILGRTARRNAMQRRLPPDILKYVRTLNRVENNEALTGLLAKPTPDKHTAPIENPAPPEVSTSRPPVAVETLVPVDDTRRDTGIETATAPPRTPEEMPDKADAAPEQALHLVMEVLGLTSINRTELESIRQRAEQSTDRDELRGAAVQLVNQKQEEIDELRDELAELHEEVQGWQLEAGEAQDERQRLSDETRWLRGKLREVKAFEVANSLTPDSEITEYPNDYHDLLRLLRDVESEGIVFTGNPEECQSLADHDPLCTSARTCWEAVLALLGYIRARSDGAWSSGVHDYLMQPPDGYRAISAKKHGRRETAVTMQQWGDQRRFPVPLEVSSTGKIEMQAHFKIGTNGTISPRMHYLDRWSQDRKIYIGYIGRHLKNTKTN
ncbi:hypothetical protein [Nocardia pseudovaccinii]|uniref:hypothetical protein n=1 Tax=Nocardia pseudovaccinii TaxID=189540 RepID=UPI0007A3EFDA|nr:hypothetical protein [Nocardia pseudovaccinii]